MTEKQRRMIYGVAKKLGMDSELLHARCFEMFRREHLSELSVMQAAALIDSLTGTNTSSFRRRRERPLDRASQEQINLILGLAKKLGWLEGGSKKRLMAFLRARFGVNALDWMEPDTAVKVTEALKAMLRGGRGERKDYDSTGKAHEA